MHSWYEMERGAAHRGLVGLVLPGLVFTLFSCAGSTRPPAAESPDATPILLSAGAHLTAEQLLSEIDSWRLADRREALKRWDTAFCAAFDADGTLWRKDLSETLVARAVEGGAVRTEALAPYNAMLERFGEPPATTATEAIRRFGEAYGAGRVHTAGAGKGLSRDQVDLEIWPSYNFVFAGWSVRAVKRATREVLEAGFAGEVFVGMRTLLARLRGQGLRTVVISSTLEPAVREAAARLGFRPEEVSGQRSRLEGGRLTADILPPILYGEGKVEAARALCGGRPLLVFADSAAGSDRLMLESARVRIVVQPHGRHLEHATREGWPVLEMPDTEGAGGR